MESDHESSPEQPVTTALRPALQRGGRWPRRRRDEVRYGDGRIAAGVLLVFLVVSAVVNARYGLVARQHALLTASSAASEDVAPVSNPV
jgi:hypothetical protein